MLKVKKIRNETQKVTMFILYFKSLQCNYKENYFPHSLTSTEKTIVAIIYSQTISHCVFTTAILLIFKYHESHIDTERVEDIYLYDISLTLYKQKKIRKIYFILFDCKYQPLREYLYIII